MARKGSEGRAAEDKPPHSIIVLDTNVFFAASEPYKLKEFLPFAPAEYVVPAKVIWELDQKMQALETRDRARAALHVLQRLMQRDAARRAVTCGNGSTIRFGLSSEEEPRPGLDMNLADDRIVALFVHLASLDSNVKLATTDFALAAKASAVGITPIWLQELAEDTTALTRRERLALRSKWARIQAANSSWAACRAAVDFLRLPIARQLLQPVRDEQEPADLYGIILQFDELSTNWTEKTSLDSLIQSTLGSPPAPQVDFDVKMVTVPAPRANLFAIQGLPGQRPESSEERALRIAAEENQRKAWEDYIVDRVLGRMELVWDYVLDRAGDIT